MKVTSLLLVGVGGQGTLHASKLIGHVMIRQGYEVRVSEIHGMSQRGGSVVTYVRFGEDVYSPIVNRGEADFMVAMEKLEAARYIDLLKPEGQLVVNTQEIDPMPVITGATEYPHDILEKLKAMGVKVDAMDALAVANEAGLNKMVNTVLMGRLSNYFDIPEEVWLDELSHILKPKIVEMNQKAFLMGRNYKG